MSEIPLAPVNMLIKNEGAKRVSEDSTAEMAKLLESSIRSQRTADSIYNMSHNF